MGSIQPDHVLQKVEFEDLNTISGLPIGTNLIIQNKSSDDIFLQVSDVKPTPNLDIKNQEGRLVAPYTTVLVYDEVDTIWAFGKGPINIEPSY